MKQTALVALLAAFVAAAVAAARPDEATGGAQPALASPEVLAARIWPAPGPR